MYGIMASLAKCCGLIFICLTYFSWFVSHQTNFLFQSFFKLFIMEISKHIPK